MWKFFLKTAFAPEIAVWKMLNHQTLPTIAFLTVESTLKKQKAFFPFAMPSLL
jgi:hypothetical protein